MNQKKQGLNDKAWEKLFKKFDIEERINCEGKFEITSSQINEFREARIMTKFDHKFNLPNLFKKNNLAILPISRRKYVISNFKNYHSIKNDNRKVKYLQFPSYIKSIDYSNITSEATAINCAYVSGIFLDFIEEEKILPTINGRMGSNYFDFDIKLNKDETTMNICVNNSQIEIDGGYESKNSLTLIEAKLSISKDFIIRQIYYPFRLWSNNINKEIKTVFMVYSNGVFKLYEYKFEDINFYNSLNLIKQKNYSVEPFHIESEDVQKILYEVKIIPEPKIPFPQANDFNKVINLCELLFKKSIPKENLLTEYDFSNGSLNVDRQTDYYTNAGRYLGFVDKKKDDNQIEYFLTNEGNKLFKLKLPQRQLKFVEMILRHKVFNDTMKLYFSKLRIPSKSEIFQIMKMSNLYNIDSENTFRRRSSSIVNWIKWIVNLFE